MRSFRGDSLGTGYRRLPSSRWKSAAGRAELTRDQMERISYILGVYGRLHAILANSALADDWIRRPNTDFGGAPPLGRMLTGDIR